MVLFQLAAGHQVLQKDVVEAADSPFDSYSKLSPLEILSKQAFNINASVVHDEAITTVTSSQTWFLLLAHIVWLANFERIYIFDFDTVRSFYEYYLQMWWAFVMKLEEKQGTKESLKCVIVTRATSNVL